jgi:hypothetical protein
LPSLQGEGFGTILGYDLDRKKLRIDSKLIKTIGNSVMIKGREIGFLAPREGGSMSVFRRNRTSVRVGFRLILLALVLGWTAVAASAQYFGRNKVQYQKFDYQVLRTDHFEIYYYPEEAAAIRVAAQMAERWYNRYARVFNHDLKGKQALIMYASHPQFEQTTVLSELITEGTGGVTESFKRRIILPFGATLSDTDHVIGHELVHAFQYDMAVVGGQRYNPQGASGGLERTPLFSSKARPSIFPSDRKIPTRPCG